MALNIFGNDPSTNFESEQITAISGQTQAAVSDGGSWKRVVLGATI